MKTNKSGQPLSFYLSIAANILAVIALIFYRMASDTLTVVLVLSGISLLSEAVFIFLAWKTQESLLKEIMIPAEAIISASALGMSFTTQIENLGYLVAGLRKFDDVKFYIFYVAAALAALLLLIITSYMRYEKNNYEIKIEEG